MPDGKNARNLMGIPNEKISKNWSRKNDDMTGHDLKKLPDKKGKIKKNHRGTELIKEGGFLPKAPSKIRI